MNVASEIFKNPGPNPSIIIDLDLSLQEAPQKHELQKQYIDDYKRKIGINITNKLEKPFKQNFITSKQIDTAMQVTSKIEKTHRRMISRKEDLILQMQPMEKIMVTRLENHDEKFFYKPKKPQINNKFILNNVVFNTILEQMYTQKHAIHETNLDQSTNMRENERKLSLRQASNLSQIYQVNSIAKNIIQKSSNKHQEKKDIDLSELIGSNTQNVQSFLKLNTENKEQSIHSDLKKSNLILAQQLDDDSIQKVDDNLMRIQSRVVFDSGKPFFQDHIDFQKHSSVNLGSYKPQRNLSFHDNQSINLGKERSFSQNDVGGFNMGGKFTLTPLKVSEHFSTNQMHNNIYQQIGYNINGNIQETFGTRAKSRSKKSFNYKSPRLCEDQGLANLDNEKDLYPNSPDIYEKYNGEKVSLKQILNIHPSERIKPFNNWSSRVPKQIVNPYSMRFNHSQDCNMLLMTGNYIQDHRDEI